MARTRFFRLLAVALVAAVLTPESIPAAASAGAGRGMSAWQQQIVTVEVARNDYDYNQPWSRKARRLRKTGLVMEGRQVLTTAADLSDRTLIRLQKNGRGRWFIGQVTWVDYPANLALITASEEEFWRDLQPVSWGTGTPEDGNLQVLRWLEGNLENRRAEFTRFAVRENPMSPLSHVMLEVGSEIQNVGAGEPVVANSHVVGVVVEQNGRTCTAMPASFLRGLLEARQKGAYRGLGFFHFYWQQSENPALHSQLGLPGEPRGVVVSKVPPRPDGKPEVIQPRDILLKIDGFDLDVQGDYEDPEYGHLLLENLSSRGGRQAGDVVEIELWRGGEKLSVKYELPVYAYTNSLVPFANYDQQPEYLIVGGLVFQPLTDAFLQSWGPEWKRRSPFRLFQYRDEYPTKERPSLVVLSLVLPDPYNSGYESQRFLVVDKVNGRRVSRLQDLQGALAAPEGEQHLIEFVSTDGLRRMAVAAGAAEGAATTRVLQRYGIAKPFHLE